MSLSIFSFVYNSRVASFHKTLLTKCNEEEYVENIRRESPDGIPAPKHFAVLTDGGHEGYNSDLITNCLKLFFFNRTFVSRNVLQCHCTQILS